MTSPTRSDLEELERALLGAQGAFVFDHLHPHQQPPAGTPGKDWDGWLIQAGRGSGKTAAIAKYVTDHVEGPPCIPGKMPHKMALIAPTIGDAVESADRHPVCLTSIRPDAHLRQRTGGTIVEWANGSEMKLFGTNSRRDIDRLRAGGNNCLVWVEELAAWPYIADAWDQMQFGLRTGPNPHWVGSTTPKPHPAYAAIVEDARVMVHYASTKDNPHLDPMFYDRLIKRYGGTSLAAQEIEGKLLDELAGALWSMDLIEPNRIHLTPEFRRVVVGVDPSGGRTETGIIAAGRVNHSCKCGGTAPYPHGVIIGDFTDTTGSPNSWGTAVVNAYDKVDADRIVGERNFGGDMVESTIRTVRASVSYKDVNASRGKAVRAEPVRALYEQGRIHHLGRWPELESEMVTWEPDVSAWSPNRVDALVWAVTELEIETRAPARLHGDQLSTLRLPG